MFVLNIIEWYLCYEIDCTALPNSSDEDFHGSSGGGNLAHSLSLIKTDPFLQD